MRVGSSAVYTNFINNQQRNLSNLLEVNNQISSGLKIQFGYQNSTVYQDTLRLINEKATLLQVSDSTQKAKTYSDNTDVAISQMKEALESFKVKLVHAANDVHSPTSYAALAGDLEALMFNVLDVANTSINGNFLFSGTNMKQKPFDELGNYYGNNEKIKAQAGDRLELPYNTDGYTLMFGMDANYAKRMTTNMPLWNQTQLHHRVLDKTDPYGVDTQTPIQGTDSIRDLVGQPDDSQPTYFYLRGRRPDGEAFKSRIEMDNFGTVNDLLNQIGREMGNTNLSKAVDVTLSEFGHIEIKDVKSGRMLTDFHMVGSSLKTDDINEITATEDALIFEFNKSGYGYARTEEAVATRQDVFDNRIFRFNTTLRRQDNEDEATKYDTVQSVMGGNVDQLTLNINGIDRTIPITIHTTLENLMGEIKTALQADLGGSFDVDLLNGNLAIYDNAASGPSVPDEEKIHSLLQGIRLTAQNTGGEKVLAFAANDAVSYDRARFEKAGSVLSATVSQTLRADSSYATAQTELSAVAGTGSLEEKKLHLEIADITGQRKLVEVTLRDIPDENGRLSTFQVIEPTPGPVYDIFDQNGNQTTASGYTKQTLIPYADGLQVKEENLKGVTYQQLMSVMGMTLSGNLPADGSYEAWNKAAADSLKQVEASLDNTGKLKVKDLTTSQSKMQISLFDADTDRFDSYNHVSTKGLLQTYTGAKGEPGWDIKDTRTDRPLSEVFGFNFTGNLVLSGTDYNGNAATVTLNENNTLQELRDALDSGFGDGPGNGGFVTEIIEGRLIVRDNTNLGVSPVSINFAFEGATIDMQVDKSPALTFAANNALTIDQARVNIFGQMREAIAAVKTGQTRPDGNSDLAARNMGIQNAIYMIDHMLDHLNQIHTKNGAVGIALQLTYEKSEMMVLNVSELKSMVLDADIGEAVMRMNQQSIAYQALLSTIGRINQLSLVNFLK
ncbi:MAG: flagellin [Campylobacterales bacterium]